ncbi:MAG: hypothetical protein DRP13_04015 [Candidatus Aenigmatarchaeota archaeon]|nr:MAG: hypothetical protein DRP13_04015 [Candidatus Aenigmarchaeota archaeon]
MPRPRMCRRVWFDPRVRFFGPRNVESALEVVLSIDEFESIRLRDFENLNQTESAEKMGISQPTFQRIYDSARKKIADALVNGKVIRIEGGNYMLMKCFGRRFRGGFKQ